MTENEMTIKDLRLQIKCAKELISDLRAWGKLGWTRADMFEGALKTKQNYNIQSNSLWYRGRDGRFKDEV
jgi:hypothetical protein